MLDETTWTCGYCLWSVESGQPWKQCASCERVVHQECWDENGGCTTLGCFEHAVVEPPDYTTHEVIPAEPPDGVIAIALPPPYVPPSSEAAS